MRTEPVRQGWALPENDALEVFKLDIELNAQGLEAWLDSNNRGRETVFPLKIVDTGARYRASSRHR